MARPGSDFPDPQLVARPGADGAATRALAPLGAPGAGAATREFAPRGPEILTGGFNQTWLVNCLRRRWMLATLLGLLMAGLTMGMLMWLFPESSRITSYLEVKTEDDSSPWSPQSRVVSHQLIEREAQRHLALIRSPLVIERAILDNDDIRNLDAVQAHKGEEVLWMLNELKVSFMGDSPILEVRYDGEERPEDMVQVIKAIVRSYKDNVLQEERLQRATTRDDLRLVLAQVKRELERKLDELRNMKEIDNYLQFQEVELPRLRSELQLFQTQLNSTNDEINENEVNKELALQAARSPAALEAAVQAALEKDPTVNMYQQQLFMLSQQIQTMEASTRNKQNAQLMRLQAQYSQTQAAMDQYRVGAERSLRERAAKLPNEALRAAIAEYNVRKEYLLKKKAELDEKIQAHNDRITEMSIGDPKVDMLQADIENQQELVKMLELKLLEWNVQTQAEQLRPSQPGKDSEYDKVKVIQQALATEQINTKERWAIAGIGGLGAFALTCYTIALIEFRRRRLNGPDDMEEGLGIRVLGVLPPASLKAISGQSSTAVQVAEAIDSVRAAIMHDSTRRGARQVVMVASPASMEGSTTVAASLALSLARAGRRTLLIDGDLRSPTLHKLFGVPLEDGFSEVLRSEIDLADAVRPTSHEGLYVLTAGVRDMDAIYALATDQPQAIFDKLRDQFDFVVVDSPPVLGLSDALSLGQYIDAAVLTVLRDHSELRRVYQAAETLRLMGVRLVGCVVNGMPSKADRRVSRSNLVAPNRTPRLPAKTEAPRKSDDLDNLGDLDDLIDDESKGQS